MFALFFKIFGECARQLMVVVNRGSFDCSFLLLLCFCCYHFRKLIDFSTLYGIYRRYGCLSKCTKKKTNLPTTNPQLV